MCNSVRFWILAFVSIFGLITILEGRPKNYDNYEYVKDARRIFMKQIRHDFIFIDNIGLRTTQCRKNGYKLKIFDSCDCYAECTDGIPLLTLCRDHDIYDDDTQRCIHPEKAKCKLYCRENFTVVYQDPFQSEKYHICLDGYDETFTCPPNSHFDTDTRECHDGKVHVHIRTTTTRRPPSTPVTRPPPVIHSHKRTK